MNRKKSLILVLAAAGGLAAGAAQARGTDDVRWSITIGSPGVAVAPVVVPTYPVVVRHAPPAPVRVVYQQPTRWDRDGDGIPNHRDRLYNPRWDIDGDGIPNRHDRFYNPRWDRDGDGVPNRYDPRPDHAPRGWGR